MDKLDNVSNISTLSLYPHNIIDTIAGLFISKFKVLPNIECHSSINVTTLEAKLEISPSSSIAHYGLDEDDYGAQLSNNVFYGSGSVWFFCSNIEREDKKSIAKYFYIFYTSVDNDLYKSSRKFIEKNKHKSTSGKVYLLVQEGAHMGVRSFKLAKPKIEFSMNYNEGFEEVHDKMVERLNKKNGNGLFILHGQPGTGKTTYLKFLTHFIKSKRVIFIPANYVQALASPEFISFLMDYRDSILIVEEAENVLSSVSGTRNQAVSNLLNITDGILGDCLNIQIIATFNTDLTNIDSALIRKGRLVSKYEFKQLTSDRAQALATSLGIENVMSDESVSEKTTLANIYNLGENPTEETTERRIGFRK